MKSYPPYLLFTMFLFAICSIANAQFQYLSPEPGTIYHYPSTTITLRNGNTLDSNSLKAKNLFTVIGTLSGQHQYQIKLVEQDKTIILIPRKPFANGETVTVDVETGIRTIEHDIITGVSFDFQIRQLQTQEEKLRIASQMKELYQEENPLRITRKKKGQPGFPAFTIDTNINPAPGEIFWSNFNYFTGLDDHYCIIKSNGDSVFGKYDTTIYNDFDLNKNGYPTVYHDEDSAFVVLDSNYNQMTEYQMGNGYKADPHEFIINTDGIHYMISYDPEIIDMTVYNPTYQPNATVIGCIFQELDANNNVLFQWRSWDHYSILDGDHINFAIGVIDYCHANSIEPDNDGNLIFSCRNMSEVTKVDRTTGNIIWRWGGLNNQFTFIGDTAKFSYQHDARRIANGNITMFDNGNFHSPARSYAKEYILDEVNKTATLKWSYTRAITGGNVFAKAMGNVQRLSNGHSFICWGLVQNQAGAPKFTELDSSSNVVWEMSLETAEATYRGHRHDWEPCARPTASTLYADQITSTSAKVHWGGATNASSYDLQYRKLGNTSWKLKTATTTTKKLKNLIPNQAYEYELKSHCTSVPTSESGFTAIKTFTTLPLKQILAEEVVSSSFNIYPNPVNDQLQLKLFSGTPGKLHVTFYDVSGRMILSREESLTGGDQVLLFDVSTLSSGVYLAEMKTDSEKVIQKFVKE